MTDHQAFAKLVKELTGEIGTDPSGEDLKYCVRLWNAGMNQAFVKVKVMLVKQRELYFAQMEGQGEPEFQQLDFACDVVGHLISSVILLQKDPERIK